MPLFLYRGEGEAGSLFGEVFQGDSSGISGAFQRGFPSCFYGKIWEQEGKRGWKGGEDVGEGEEKISSATTLYFNFTIDYDQALAFRRANGDYLRERQWKDLTVEVYII